MAPRVFLITGTSTGFGNELVKVVLEKGDIAVATARNSSKLSFPGENDPTPNNHYSPFSTPRLTPAPGTSAKNFLALDLDVTDESSISKAIKSTLSKFSRIDVLVNNAGYGLSGEFESLSDAQIRKQMEVNFFGLINVTREAMAAMREQKPPGGVIQQVTSIGGQRGVPTFSIYCASKWAVEGFTEAVAQEVKPEWGIRFTCVEPGGFRTDWGGRSMDFGEKKNEAYDHIDARKRMEERHMKQAGDPPKAAKAMYELAVMEDPPLRCILGSDAYTGINAKLESYRENVKKFEKLSNSTDVDGYQRPQ